MHHSQHLPTAFPRLCPSCGTSPAQLLYRQQFMAPEQGGLLAGYGVYACSNCGLGFASPLPDQSDFDKYYARLSKYEYSGSPSEADLARHQQMAALIRRLRGTAGRVLDMGCATGWFMQALLREGFSLVEGIEPSPTAVERACAMGLSVSVGTLWSPSEDSDPWDLLILSAVLEHVYDLNAAIKKLRSLISTGGHLFLQLPDASRFTEAIDAPFQEFSLEHINFFGPRSLQSLMAKHGFKLVHLEQATVEIHARQKLPELKALFQKSSGPIPSPAKDYVTSDALVKYIQQSREREAELAPRLEALAASQQPILVWGVGSHTQHLLEATPLSRCRITAFLDSNQRYQGLQMAGSPILAPSVAADYPLPILIGSYQYQSEIAHLLRHELGLPNPIIELYPEFLTP